MQRALLMGHRGAAAERPENTMVSFERAIELGVDVLETDAHLTADGHVVLAHDADGRRMTGVGWRIAASSLREVQRWDAGWGFVDARGERPFSCRGVRIPTLREVLDAFPGARLNIDVKQRAPSMVERLLAVLRGHEQRVTIASFHDDVVREVRARGYPGSTALSAREVQALLVLRGPLRHLWPIRGSRVQVPPRVGPLDLGTRAFIDRCHALGLVVDYWVVNDRAQAAALLERGTDGVITDDPAKLRPLFARA
jgi:glycerophosphoryl diester phosphodiesterase